MKKKSLVMIMGQTESEIEPQPKIKINIVPKKHDNLTISVPYQQLEMIRLLQSHFKYEVKGTLIFDNSYKFKGFEIRTDQDELYSTGASNWKIFFHTHPDKTAQKYGIRYYSPPSVDDVMEIYDYSRKYMPDTISNKFGENSIIFTNEGLYILRADRGLYKKQKLNEMTEDEQEEFLNREFNPFIVDFIKTKIKTLYQLKTKQSDPVVNFDNPDISYDQFSTMVKALAQAVTEKFGFSMTFYDWNDLEKNGLVLKTSTFFVNSKVFD